MNRSVAGRSVGASPNLPRSRGAWFQFPHSSQCFAPRTAEVCWIVVNTQTICEAVVVPDERIAVSASDFQATLIASVSYVR